MVLVVTPQHNGMQVYVIEIARLTQSREGAKAVSQSRQAAILPMQMHLQSKEQNTVGRAG